MRSTTHFRTILIALLCASLVAFTSGAFAQNDNGQGDTDRIQQGTREQAHDRTEDQLQDGAREQTRDRDRIHARIDAEPGMTGQERARMHANLDECIGLGIPAASAEAMFPGNGAMHEVSAAFLLRIQDRVMKAAREGLTVEPMLAKLQEGRTKGVPEPRLEQACDRIENHVRTASRIMQQNAAAGSEPPTEPARYRAMQGEMAGQIWRGMNEEGYGQIREQAQKQLRSGDCGSEDLVAAGEVATRLMEAGVQRERALRFAGDALQNGYRYQQMRQIQIMVAARNRHGEGLEGFVAGLEYCVDAGMGTGELYGYMLRNGWMGPGDMYGPGGMQPADMRGHGGGQGTGGDDGSGHHDDGKRHGGNPQG